MNNDYEKLIEQQNKDINEDADISGLTESTQYSEERISEPIPELAKENVKSLYQYYKYENNNRPKAPVFPKYFIAFLIVVMIITLSFAIYCIVVDASKGAIGSFTADKVNKNFILQTENKPEIDEGKYKDDSGKYTTEGIAKLVKPSIVEIFTYNYEVAQDSAIGSGSGIIISTDGYIVTNAHVLENAADFTVVLYDKTEYKGRIVGKDTKTDIAVIKIEADDLYTASFGNSDEVEVGEQVMAIGNPAGLTGSVTDGIVSGVDRLIKTDTTGFEMNCIQTNAAISPGNSGGALVNMYGQVIGITSSKYVNSSYEGLGFAITINEAKPIIEELMGNGYVSGRVKIGIVFISSDNYYAKQDFKSSQGYDIPEDIHGLWINEIDESCDIANTELQVNDFIVSVNGTEVTDYDSLYSAIKDKTPDDIFHAKVVRTDKSGEKTEFEIEFHLMADISGNY